MRMREALFGMLAAGGMLATGAAAAQEGSGKFRLDGDTLVYNTETPAEGEVSGILSEDVDVFLALLRANPGIAVVELNSSGGEVYAATQIKDVLIDFGLDTRVHGECDSSCVTVFLGGKRRTMSRGSRIGFHQIYWSAENIATYYENERETQGWKTPFDFAAWMYLDTQEEVYANLEYMLSRGVDPGFAIKTNPQGDIWRPLRSELLQAGVLTE